MSSKYIDITEGKVRLKVPNPELFKRKDGVYEPSWAPVFYNPRATAIRDLSVLTLASVVVLNNLQEVKVADVLAGVGVRGIRYALEVPNVVNVILNDINPEAVKLIKENVLLNNLGDRAGIYGEDANALLYKLKASGVRLDFIDIDPYGTPTPFIRSALWSVRRGGFLGITATDIAPLSGSRWLAGSRKYDVRIFKTDFGYEVGLRILLGYIARRAAEMERSIKPLISVLYDQYYRVTIVVDKGVRKSQEMLSRDLGYIYYCSNCLFRRYSTDIELEMLKCPKCGSRLELIGPLWIGSLVDREFLKCLNTLAMDYMYLGSRDKLVKMLKIIENEVNVPYYYELVALSSKLRINVPKVDKVIECLTHEGYEASRTHLSSTGVKTSADYDVIVSCLRRLTQ